MLFAAIAWLALDNPAAHPRVETLSLTSKVFGNTRTIRVLLPPGYSDPANEKRSYPVAYLSDGSMVFRKNAIDVETLALPPVIIVGIDNAGTSSNRANEFLPYPDVGFPSHAYAPDPPDPHGKSYPAFLIDEVMPLIASKYRVLSGPENTAIGGFSYGGVAALYTVMARPEVFGKLMLESTPLWIGENRQLLRDAERVEHWPERVYVGVGTDESIEQDVNAEGQKDIDTLLATIRRASPSTQLKSVTEKGARHATSFWRGRLPAAMEFLFASPRSFRSASLRVRMTLRVTSPRQP